MGLLISFQIPDPKEEKEKDKTMYQTANTLKFVPQNIQQRKWPKKKKQKPVCA